MQFLGDALSTTVRYFRKAIDEPEHLDILTTKNDRYGNYLVSIISLVKIADEI